MSWNYRIIEQSINGDISIGIHEVFYNDKKEIVGYTTEPIEITWTEDITLDEMNKRLNKAFDEKILIKEKIDQYLAEKHSVKG